MNDSLGDRMKAFEKSFRTKLPDRFPVIMRVDGRAFSNYTRGCKKPFDERLIHAMNECAIALCKEIQGAQVAYVQSDEISILIHNYKRFDSQAWFGNQVQKMCSVAASIASVFNNTTPTLKVSGLVIPVVTSLPHAEPPMVTRTRWVVDSNIPIFSQDRNYIGKYLATEEG